MGKYDDCIVASFHIQEDTYRKFRLYCLEHRSTVKEMVRNIIEDFMKKNPSVKKRKIVKKA